MKPLFYVLSGAFLLGLSSCGIWNDQDLYTWKNYETTSYAYYKKQTPEATANLMKTYQQIIDNPGGERKAVPPGVYAEYGYLLLKDGKKEESLKMFKTEMELYPESATFMNLLIKKFEQ